MGKSYVSAFKILARTNYVFIKSALERRKFRAARALANLSHFPLVEEVLAQPYYFVLSTGRCGTGLITELLSKAPELRVEHNPKPELEYVSSVIHRHNCHEDALEIAILAARFDSFFLDTFLRGKLYVETNNRISFFAPALAKLLPNAKFIHLVRNPADFVRSGMRRGYYHEGVVQHQRLNGSDYLPWSSFSRLEKVAWEWNEINRKIEEFKTNVDVTRVLTINSESLYKDPATTFKIFKFIDTENPYLSQKGARMLAKMLSKPVNKQIQGTFPRYPDWSESDKKALRCIATLASKYGYSYQ
jgi:hypothetical protein